MASAATSCPLGSQPVDVLAEFKDASQKCAREGKEDLKVISDVSKFSFQCVNDDGEVTGKQPSVCPGNLQDCLDGIQSGDNLPTDGPVLLMDETCSKLLIQSEGENPNKLLSVNTMRADSSPCEPYSNIRVLKYSYDGNRGYTGSAVYAYQPFGPGQPLNSVRENHPELGAIKTTVEVELFPKGNLVQGQFGWMLSDFSVCIPVENPTSPPA